ncbi:MAG: ABC transporter permease [Verrucomicrobiales bacterium]|nr:ABC transporter permease [Verrucomicrobiota bacterium JB025]
MGGNVPQLGLAATALSLTPILAAGWFYHRWCGGGRMLAYATGRMLVQLLAIGFVLVYLFENPHPAMCLLILAVVMSTSAWIALRHVKMEGRRYFPVLLAALALGGLPVLVLDLLVVQQGRMEYLPKFFIPLAGMVFGSSMNILSLAAERFEAERKRGAGFEQARNVAFRASMIPRINSYLAVGMVSLPGMMTGQILAGISPLVAVRYQILIMAMIMGSSAMTVACYFVLNRKTLEEGAAGSGEAGGDGGA